MKAQLRSHLPITLAIGYEVRAAIVHVGVAIASKNFFFKLSSYVAADSSNYSCASLQHTNVVTLPFVNTHTCVYVCPTFNNHLS